MKRISLSTAAALSTVVACLTLLFCSADLYGQFQVPAVPVNPASEPEQSEPVAENEKAAQAIRETLDGKAVGGSGDGVLEDVLGVIRSQGSVLENSELAQAEGTINDSMKSHENSRRSVADVRAHAAEQLLRASRLLVQLPGGKTNQTLVDEMRAEAKRLLTAEDVASPKIPQTR